MAVRILLALAILTIFYGCGQPDSVPGQGEKGEGGELGGAIPLAPEQLKSTKPVAPEQQLVFGIHGVGLYVMDPAGSNPTRLTDGDSPAWSPDGKQIAYTRYVKVPNPLASNVAESADANGKSPAPAPYIQTPSIFVTNADGSGGRQLLNKSAMDPEWSPDGKEIAFTPSKGTERLNCGIYVTDADGSGTPRKLATGPGCASSPAWSPDGKKIAYTIGPDPEGSGGRINYDVHVVNASGEEGGTDQLRALTDGAPRDALDPNPRHASDPSWSPDGTEIAFRYEDHTITGKGESYTGKGGIYKMNADGSGKTPIALRQYIKSKDPGEYFTGDHVDSKYSPVWSPDGDHIAYVRSLPDCDPSCNGSFFTQIYVIDSSGRNPTLIRDLGAGRDVKGLDWRR